MPNVPVLSEALVLSDLRVKSAIEASSVIIKRGNEEPPRVAVGGTLGTLAGPQGEAFLYKYLLLNY